MHVERLDRRHERSGFTCGRVELDIWFRRYALQAERRSQSARTFVLMDDERVVGFYSLTAFGITADESPDDLLRGQPRYPVVPAALLARLAIDEAAQGAGLGERLLADAVRRVVVAAEHMAIVLLVVDALDDKAAGFYERYGFRRLEHSGIRLRLAARLKDLRRTFSD